MPRRVSRSTRTRPRRPTKWCAAVADDPVANSANLTIADSIRLCASFPSEANQPDPVVGWCKGSISISRLISGEDTPVIRAAIVMCRLDPATADPVQIFNPFNSADLERQDILWMGSAACPPTVLNAADAKVIDRSSTVLDINCKVSRKFATNTNNLFLWIATATTDNLVQAHIVVRSLMKFG